MPDPTDAASLRFRWPDTAARLRQTCRAAAVPLSREGDRFHGGAVTFVPPLVQRPPPTVTTAADFQAWLPGRLGLHLVVLLQAGAAAAGVWREDELLAHKATKKYVVRGHGRAQPTHLRQKGKSRHGSRLRLRNARSLLQELNQRLVDWRDEHGAFDQVWYACPVRLWAELLHAEPSPPFAKDEAHKVPLDVGVPTFAELQRVRGFLTWGRIENDAAPG